MLAEKHLIEAKKELKAHEVSKPRGVSKTEDLASAKASAEYWLRVILLLSGFLFVGRLDAGCVPL